MLYRWWEVLARYGEEGVDPGQIFISLVSFLWCPILLEESCNQKANIALINPQQVTVSFLVLGAFSSLVICFSAVSLLLFLVSLYPAHFLSIVSPLNLFQIIVIWACHLIPSVTLANRVNIFDLLNNVNGSISSIFAIFLGLEHWDNLCGG